MRIRPLSIRSFELNFSQHWRQLPLAACRLGAVLKRHRSIGVLFALMFTALFIGGCEVYRRQAPEHELTPPAQVEYRSYQASVQPILNRRCVVCHSCFDAPCQLNTAAFDGVDRGATSTEIYADRLTSIPPTRLFMDAQSMQQWRELGFFPVVQHFPPNDERNLSQSILFQLIDRRSRYPLPQTKFDAYRQRTCPNLLGPLAQVESKFSNVLAVDPYASLAMPYGLPRLRDDEYFTLRRWMELGAPGPAGVSEQPPEEDRAAVARWEEFLNSADPRHQLVARYLYEHLFLAHLFVREPAPGKTPAFYRLIRSKTAAPDAPQEIATRRPVDPPSGDDTGFERFFYRLRPLHETMVHKSHLPFRFDDAVLRRIEQLFFRGDWQLSSNELPSYRDPVTANPFVTFQKIPAEARYRFMIENSEYFVSSFMKGPVCRGQLALNVIDDFFFMFFLDPRADQSVQQPSFLTANATDLMIPFRPEDLFASSIAANARSLLELPLRALDQLRYTYYPFFKRHQLAYLKARDEYYVRARSAGFSLEDIWDGDGWNQNAALTIFRHFDAASVTKGAVGGIPKTVLVLDYPIFERMYYNLVANFDIFGDIKSQLATRLYMDDLRIEGEDLFLSFLPRPERLGIRRSWYRGAEAELNSEDYPLYGADRGTPLETRVEFAGDSPPKDELIQLILNRRLSQRSRGWVDSFNRSAVMPQDPVDRQLATLGDRTGRWVSMMPELVFLRVRDGDNSGGRTYSLVRNRAHLNIKFLFSETGRFAEAEDTVSVLPGFAGSHPHFFFDVDTGEVADFVAAMKSLTPEDDSFKQLINRWGIHRTDSRIWELSDWFHEAISRDDPINAGIFDLSRYQDL